MFSADMLIGLRVMHIHSHSIGRIISISGNKMVIDYHGKISTCTYPDAFYDTIELENEDIQEELKNTACISSFKSTIRIFKSSINAEIEYIKSSGSKRYKIIDGELINTTLTNYTYAFETDTDIHFPDSTPIRLYTNNGIYNAVIISCEDYTIF